MKTPREILLERHQAVAPKLDAIRREVLDAEFNAGQASSLSSFEKTGRPETGRMPVLLLIWCELVFPCRHVWAGLTAVWVVIVAVNFSMRGHSPTFAERSAPPMAEMVLSWQQQEQLVAELIGPDEFRAAAPAGRNSSPPDRQKPSSLRPSSERIFEMMTA